METMKKRSILQFALLNIITLGIWGIIESYKIGRDVDMLCSGDGETETSYIKAWLLGIITAGIYHEYWWYKQANRLKLNAGRYNLKVRESGLSMIAFRMWGSGIKMIFSIIIAVFVIMSLISATFISSTFGIYGYGIGDSLAFRLLFGGNWITALIKFISIITPAWGIMGYIGLSFMMKNLNRLAEVYDEHEPAKFDPLGYEYYGDKTIEPKPPVPSTPEAGHIIGISGSAKNYRFEVKDGEEIIIGKNSAVANVIIEAKYDGVSKKHCGITYLAAEDEYLVIDYNSTNGTYIDGKRMPAGMKRKVTPGTEIVLGQTDNKFIVG